MIRHATLAQRPVGIDGIDIVNAQCETNFLSALSDYGERMKPSEGLICVSPVGEGFSVNALVTRVTPFYKKCWNKLCTLVLPQGKILGPTTCVELDTIYMPLWVHLNVRNLIQQSCSSTPLVLPLDMPATD